LRFFTFLGNEPLQKGPAPIKGRFSWACITGELDRNKGHWFGLVKIMRDPQMWTNKWLSQMLHILNSTAKDGIVADGGGGEMGSARYDRVGDPRAWCQTRRSCPSPVAGHVDLIMQFAITSILLEPIRVSAADRKPELKNLGAR
jgi:hypothetical protein